MDLVFGDSEGTQISDDVSGDGEGTQISDSDSDSDAEGNDAIVHEESDNHDDCDFLEDPEQFASCSNATYCTRKHVRF